MKFEEVIDKCVEKGTKVFVNGMDDQGKIIKKEDDFIRFELINNAEKQEDTTKEVILIPINQIFCISQGAKKAATLTATTEEEKSE